MRTAAVCPTCATFTNSLCVIYNGVYLSNINASPLDTLDTILSNIDGTVAAVNANIVNINGNIVTINTNINSINNSITSINSSINTINNNLNTLNNTVNGLFPLFGSADPTQNSSYIGQSYINTTTGQMFFSISTGVSTIWQPICINCGPSSSRIFSNVFDLTFN